MDVFLNPPLKEDEDPLTAPERGIHENEARGSAPHLRNASVPPQDHLRVENSKAPEIPIAELKLLAIAHGMSDGASVNKRASRVRVYIFLVASVSIGAFVAWQHYGATEKLNTAIVSSLPFSRPVSKEAAATNSDVVASGSSDQGVADPADQKVILSPPAPSSPSSEAKRLDAIVNELAIVRQGLQQLTANQEELARNVAALQPTRENTRQKLPPSNVSRGTATQQRRVSSTPPLQVGALPPPPPPAPPLANQTAISDHRDNIPRPPSSMSAN